MADRSVVVRLRAEVDGFKRSMSDAAKSTQQLGDKASDAVAKNADSINTLANQAGVIGIGMVAVAGAAVKSFADFDAAMSSVQAATMETSDNMDLLRDAAMEAGARTAFSATEAAGAVENLAKAGVSTADILGGALDGSLDLAAAGSLGVAEAAEIAATTLTQFGLEGRDATRVADVLAAGAGKAQGEVTDLAAAMKYAGIPSAQLGVSLEETAGTLALFAKNGLIGEQAGTSFRSMLMSLTAPSKIAKDELDRLGISVFDGMGNFIGLEGAAGTLQDRLGSLSDAERNAALGRIFGNESIQAANVLVSEGAEGVREWTQAVDDQGYAAEVAAARMDNLKGDLEQLSGSVETAMINLGESADGPLRSLAQHATDVVNAIGEMPPAAQTATLALVGGGGLALVGAAGMAKLTIAVNESWRALVDLTGSAAKARGVLRTVGIGVGVAAGAWAAAEAFDALGDKIDDAVYGKAADIAQLSTSLKNFADSGVIAGEAARTFGDDLSGLDDALSGVSGFEGGVGRVRDALEKVVLPLRALPNAYDDARESLTEYDTVLKDALDSGDMQTYEILLSEITRRAEEQGISQEALADLLPESTVAYEDAAVAAENAAQATDLAAIAAEAGARATEAHAEALEKWREEVAQSDSAFINLAGAYDAVIAKNQEYAESIAASTESAEDSWQDYYDGLTVSSTDYIAELQRQVDAQSAWETNILEISGRVRDGMTGDMQTAAEKMIDELLKLGPEGAAQVQLLKDMSDAEFEQVVTLWSQRGTEAVEEFTDQVEDYRQPTIDVNADTSPALTAIQGLWNRWHNSSMNVYIDAITRGGVGSGPAPLKQATGGYVTGPGTTTSDSIPALLSNREYVIKADAVDHYGKGFFDSLNAMRFSTGGYVGPSSSTAPAAAGGATEVVGVKIMGPNYMGDPDHVARQSAARVRDALTSYGVTGV